MNQGAFGYPGPPDVLMQSRPGLWIGSPAVIGGSISNGTSGTLNRANFTYFTVPRGTTVTAVTIRMEAAVASSSLRWAAYDSDGFLPVNKLAGGLFDTSSGGAQNFIQRCRFKTPTGLFFVAGAPQGAVPNLRRLSQNVFTTPYAVNTLNPTVPNTAQAPGCYRVDGISGEFPARLSFSDIAGVDNANTYLFNLLIEVPGAVPA